jgi:hypothetical protein
MKCCWLWNKAGFVHVVVTVLLLLLQLVAVTISWHQPLSTSHRRFVGTGGVIPFFIAMSASSSSSLHHSTKHQVFLPRVPQLPDPIVSNIPGTWAYDTMNRRVDGEILERTAQDNYHTWTTEPQFAVDAFLILSRFNNLRRELQNAASTQLTYLDDPIIINESVSSEQHIQEINEWNEILRPYVDRGDTWLSAPWLVAEFYDASFGVLGPVVGWV